MVNPFQTAPRCVQWAAIILCANPVFQFVVALNVVSSANIVSLAPNLVMSMVVPLIFGFGLLFGVNLARLLFAVLMIYMIATKAMVLQRFGINSLSPVYDLTTLAAPCIAVGLCFRPEANRYFSGEKAAESKVQAPAPDAALNPAPTASPDGKAWINLGLLAVAASVSFMVIKHFTPSLENAGIRSPEIDRIYEVSYERGMANNCRMLATAMNQFFLDRPTLNNVAFTDLVGPDKFILRFTPIAGETYPAEFTRDGNMVVILRDGAHLVYNPNTGETTRLPAAQ
jgi:hypothetical protein